MENEKYGIQLTAETHLFKNAMRELGQYVKAFGQGMKESFVEQSKEIFENFKDGVKNIRNTSDATEEFEEELEETNETAKKTSTVLSSLFDKSIGKIKRFTYYLLGARSVFSLFMKYRSIYYQYNEELQYQSELSQNAIALSLAPAFKVLGDIITYASIGLAKFIELLTGVPILTKVTTKGIRDYNKSLKETQTLVSGIDEITNLTNPQNLGLASQYQALADFQKKIEEVNKWFKNNPWIQDLADGLKVVWKYLTEKVIPKVKEFITEIGGAKGALLLLGGTAVMGAIAKLIGTAGVGATAGAGLAGIAGLLTFIAGVHIITIVLKGVNELEKIQDLRQNTQGKSSDERELLSLIENQQNKLQGLNKDTDEYKNLLQEINKNWQQINSNIQLGADNYLDNIEDIESVADGLTKITGSQSYKEMLKISKQIGELRNKDRHKSGWSVLGEGFLDLFGIDYKGQKKELENLTEKYDKQKQSLQETKTIWDKIIDGLGIAKKTVEDIDNIDLGDKSVNVKYNVTADTKSADTTLNNFFKKFDFSSIFGNTTTTKSASSIVGNIADIISKAFNFHATGLDYVPYDNYPAMLHKGEAVVPAKYNPSIHSEGNDYTNDLLETLISKVDDLANRPNVFNIDGQQLARTTYPLLQAEGRNYKHNEGVSR